MKYLAFGIGATFGFVIICEAINIALAKLEG